MPCASARRSPDGPCPSASRSPGWRRSCSPRSASTAQVALARACCSARGPARGRAGRGGRTRRGPRYRRAPDAAGVQDAWHAELARRRASAIVCSNGISPQLGERDAHRHERHHRPSSSSDAYARARRRSRCSCSVNAGPVAGARVVAVGEDRADPGVAQALERGVGVLGGVVAVREVEDRRDAGVERLERADEVARVDVLGGAARRDRHPHPAEVLHQRPVGADPPKRGLPGVPVGVDEPGHDDVTGRRRGVSASAASRRGATAAMRPSSISTSPVCSSPTSASIEST